MVADSNKDLWYGDTIAGDVLQSQATSLCKHAHTAAHPTINSQTFTESLEAIII